jgi:hypothetical protein
LIAAITLGVGYFVFHRLFAAPAPQYLTAKVARGASESDVPAIRLPDRAKTAAD